MQSFLGRRSLAVLGAAGVLLAFAACKNRNLSSVKEGGGASDDALDPACRTYGEPGIGEGGVKGCKIWFAATAGNSRHHTYVLPQKLGVSADYHRVFGSHNRGKDRFKKWGVIPDPGCKSAYDAERENPNIWGNSGFNAETYGFDVCPGDEGPNGLIAAIGHPEAWENGHWKNDPACRLDGDCDLQFGTSAGGMGFRKFPNPKFNMAVWKSKAVNGWKGYSKDGGKLSDASIEPPFLIGHACGSCHISYNPINAPQNPEAPQWENIKGAVGAQYLHISEILASGMNKDTLEWQMFVNARPGTSDTSAVTHDYINNPNTMNIILNLPTRPGIRDSALPGAVQDPQAQFQPARHNYKFFGVDANGTNNSGFTTYTNELVPQILKGGEDNVGAIGAVQRVYLNIGMCSESCMSHHLSDLRVIAGRQSQQTPLRTDQCYRDCPEFRTLSKNIPNIFVFLAAQRPFDLHKAAGLESREALATKLGGDGAQDQSDELAQKFGSKKVANGARIFANHCAKCHSSRVNPEDTESMAGKLTEPDSDFYIFKERESDGLRLDWLGNDARTPVTEVNTFRCRALHSNHKRGNLWEEYASSTYANTKSPEGVPELAPNGQPLNDGRGYYRNPSLLSIWATAPFLHNNALGPELCADEEFPMGDQSTCKPADPSVKGRLALFDASFEQMFKKRPLKITRTTSDINIPFGPVLNYGGKKRGFLIRIPKGVPVTILGSLDYRHIVRDIIGQLSTGSPAESMTKVTEKLQQLHAAGADAYAKYAAEKGYVNCGMPSNAVNGADFHDIAENQGHEILKYEAGAPTNLEDKVMNEEEYQSLLAFMKLL